MTIFDKIQECKNCDLCKLEINKIKPADRKRYEKQIMFVAQNPSYKREIREEIFEENNTSDRVMKLFFDKLNMKRDDFYFSNVVKCSTADNMAPDKESCSKCLDLFYEEVNEIKPLLIIFVSKFAYNLVDLDKIKCPVISLNHPSYYERLHGTAEKACDKMFEDLVSQTVVYSQKYNVTMDFINKKIYFKSQHSLIDFFNKANNMKIYNISVDNDYKTVGIFISNKINTLIEIKYHNYCYIECDEEEKEKYSIDGIPVKRFYYRRYSDLNNKKVYEKDIHSDYRFIVDYFDYFEPVNKSELNYLTYDIETNRSVDVVNTPGEVISIVYMMNDKLEFLMLDNGKNNFNELMSKSDVRIFEKESDMLSYFFDICRQSNIITGFNISGFDNIYLVNRAKKLGLDENSISPIFKIKNMIYEEKDRLDEMKFNVYGVDLIDSMSYAKDKFFIYSLDKPSQYNLDYLGTFLKLGTKVHSDSGPYTQWLEEPMKLYEYNIQDVVLCRKIEDYMGMIDYLLSFKKLMSTFNLKWSLYNSKIIDFFILCNFSKGIVFPNKHEGIIEELEGAYVKEPISGIYKDVAVFDFSSLYPNLIRQFNLSYETISRDKFANYDILEENIKKIDTTKVGILSLVVDKLMFMKTNISNAMANSDDKTLPVKYNAIKAVINGIYGVSKYRYFRLYNINCAEAITYLGRKLIQKSEEICNNNENFKTIYIDTDSCFIHNIKEDCSKEIFENLCLQINNDLSNFIKSEFNLDNKYLKMEFETLFYKLLMTKAKKKYYGMGYYVKGKDFKDLKSYGRGIDIVKKDTPHKLRPLLEEMLKSIILGNGFIDSKNAVEKIKKEIYSMTYKDLLITKQISRELNEYKVLPQHVKAMKYSNEHLGTNFGRSNYKGGLLHVVHPATEVIMMGNEMELPAGYKVNYKKYYELFVKNKMCLFLDDFKQLFSDNKTLTEYFK
jgi:uracil-DNA glycosylase family 4